jgi:hypothetical protein
MHGPTFSQPPYQQVFTGHFFGLRLVLAELADQGDGDASHLFGKAVNNLSYSLFVLCADNNFSECFCKKHLHSSSVNSLNFPLMSGRNAAGLFSTAISLSAASSSMTIRLSNVAVAILFTCSFVFVANGLP